MCSWPRCYAKYGSSFVFYKLRAGQNQTALRSQITSAVITNHYSSQGNTHSVGIGLCLHTGWTVFFGLSATHTTLSVLPKEAGSKAPAGICTERLPELLAPSPTLHCICTSQHKTHISIKHVIVSLFEWTGPSEKMPWCLTHIPWTIFRYSATSAAPEREGRRCWAHIPVRMIMLLSVYIVFLKHELLELHGNDDRIQIITVQKCKVIKWAYMSHDNMYGTHCKLIYSVG